VNEQKTYDPKSGLAQLEAFAKANRHRQIGTLEWNRVLWRTIGKPAFKLINAFFGRLLLKLALPAAAGIGMGYWLGSVWAGVIAAVVMVAFMVDMARGGTPGAEDWEEEFDFDHGRTPGMLANDPGSRWYMGDD